MAVLAALVLLPGLAYVASVLLPYLASDLDTLSLPDLASGAPDAGLRPEDGIPEWLLLPGFAALLLAPLGALLALGGCVVQLLAAFPRHQHRVSPGVTGCRRGSEPGRRGVPRCPVLLPVPAGPGVDHLAAGLTGVPTPGERRQDGARSRAARTAERAQGEGVGSV